MAWQLTVERSGDGAYSCAAGEHDEIGRNMAKMASLLAGHVRTRTDRLLKPTGHKLSRGVVQSQVRTSASRKFVALLSTKQFQES